MRSYPGERATLTHGFVVVFHHANHVTIQNLNIDATQATQSSIQVQGADAVLVGNNITNHNRPFSCIILGSDVGYGRAANPFVAYNTIRQCGSRRYPYQDHGIYADNVVNATIARNVIWGASAWGIQLYPDAQGSRVVHNVIDGNGLGIVFGGNRESSSNKNVVEYNIISNSSIGFNIQEYWGGEVGHGNVASNNCVFNDSRRNIPRAKAGFTTLGNVVANPQYVDRTRHDYRLRSRSACRRLVG